MKALSVNISVPQKIIFNGKEQLTGYFKKSTTSIYLRTNGVENDFVADTINHGGNDKACYLFGFNHYAYWEKQFTDFEFLHGAFGENITIDHLDESNLKIGDILKIGDAEIQITQPRQPCYKLGIKFNSDKIITDFRKAHTPGIYVRVLKDGTVQKDDKMQIISSQTNAPDVLSVFRLIYDINPDKKVVTKIINNPFVAERLKKYLTNKFI